MKTLFLLLFICSAGFQTDYPSGESVLNAIDRNLSSQNRIFTSKMLIHGGRGTRTVTSKTWAEGENKAFTEYLSPPREKGVKMLKMEDNLWMYAPSTDRIIHISGHMLRQSVMGSDLSYEDMMEDSKLTDHYDATVIGVEKISDRNCWVVDLVAKTKDVSYHRRKLWVDRLRNVPLAAELYAKSGKLLKKMTLHDVVEIESRWFPKRMIFKDILKKGDGTEFIIETIAFDQPIAEHIFSKAALRR